MTEHFSPTHPVVRTAAWTVVLVALLPITMGAFVTTLKAGMAFADWPSSDGHAMLLYPWFRDLANPDKFTEHGHRLAGVLIGLCSIGLFVLALLKDGRSWVQRYAGGILLAVIAQGLLGGARVLLDRQTLAMLHSITGALFFCLCILFLVLTGRRWAGLQSESDRRLSLVSLAVVCVLPLAVFAQYLLGSSFRHLHTLLHEHIAGAVLVFGLGCWAAAALWRTDSGSLRRCGALVAASLLLQIGLGLGAYVTRLGLPAWGIVATEGSWPQTLICSLHTVGAMLLLGSAVCGAATVLRMYALDRLLGARLSTEMVSVSRPDGGIA